MYSSDKSSVVLVNLGTPDSPTPAAVRRYLREFLSDRRIVNIPGIIWKPILHGFVLPFRPRSSAQKYASVWTPQGSPLEVNTTRLANRVSDELPNADVHVAMTYGKPSLFKVLSCLAQAGKKQVLIVPLYPQYAHATIGAVKDGVDRAIAKITEPLNIHWLQPHCEQEDYIEAMAVALENHWQAKGPLNFSAGDKLLLSFHGIPTSEVTRHGDYYPSECAATAKKLRDRLYLDETQAMLTFQSKFGPTKWLTPATIETVEQLAAKGAGRVDVICPGFTADCLETLEEICILNKETFHEAGGRDFNYIPWGNDSDLWVRSLSKQISSQLGYLSANNQAN